MRDAMLWYELSKTRFGSWTNARSGIREVTRESNEEGVNDERVRFQSLRTN